MAQGCHSGSSGPTHPGMEICDLSFFFSLDALPDATLGLGPSVRNALVESPVVEEQGHVDMWTGGGGDVINR